ncbi:MAG: CoA transferase [Proteobacteria bacterium]|nr:CoA transferase [Pseudomonadota bacterium]
MTYLLEGLKVIDLASFLAAPGAGTLMGDYGAEVIKIEPPGGDGYRRLHGIYHTDYNWQLTSRNKRGMVLDIRSDEGIEVLFRLLEDADVLLVNFRNDQLEKYGIAYETLHRKFPRLIVAQLTGYGNRGPDRKRRGFDSTAWFARTGILALMKDQGLPPVFPAGGVGDHSTAMSLFAGIMMALYKREREGVGSFVETSLIANGVWANGMQLQGAIAGLDIAAINEEKGRRNPFVKVYRTRDDRYLVLVLSHPAKEFGEMAEALGHPEWKEDERFSGIRNLMHHRDDITRLFTDAIGSANLADLCLMMDEQALTYGVVEGLTEVVTDAHLIENDIVIQTDSIDENFAWTIANPIKVSGERTRPVNDPPELGEHTVDILREYGFDDDEIEQLITDSVVQAAGKA